MRVRTLPGTHWLLFVALGLAWGSSYLFIAIAIQTLSPFTLVASRLGIGSAVLGAVMVGMRRPLPRDRRTYLDFAVLAVLNLVVPFSLTSWGQRSIDSGLASVLNATIPLFAVILAALALKERISLAGGLGLAVGFLGVVILTGPGVLSGAGSSIEGEAALLGSSLSYGAAVVFVRRRLNGVDPMAMAFFQVGFAFVMTALLALGLEHPFAARWESGTAISILCLGVFASGLAYVGLFRLIESWGPTRTSTIAYLLPVVGVFLGWAVLGERVDMGVLFGTALVVGGIALANRPAGSAAPSLRRRRFPRQTGGEANVGSVDDAEASRAA